jgi:type IV secretory pathway TrbF-like protein
MAPDLTLPEYIAARHEWDERYGGLLTRARNWRIVAIITGITCLLAVAGLLWAASRSHVVPFVVMLDHLGRPVAAGLADETNANDDRIKKTTLFMWLEGARTVTADVYQQRKLIDNVYAHIASGTQAQTYVSEYYRDLNPLERAHTESVDVHVNDILATTDRTYEIDWTETIRDNFGAVKTSEHWKAALTFVINRPTDERLIRINPIGLYVVTVNWTKVL